MTAINTRYIHTDNIHNFKAAAEVVPLLANLFQPSSVADVGSGTGTWLKVFADNGLTDILGIDGHYVDKNALHIPKDTFLEFDLETPYVSEKKFDLALSLEVAEHLKPESADIFVKTLTGLSDLVVFSAAVPNQGGQNHINEQEPAYWIEKFSREGFQVFDVLRPMLWDNKNVDWWYRQNMFVFCKNPGAYPGLQGLKTFYNAHLVHPETLLMKENSVNQYQRYIEALKKGKKGMRIYLEMLWNAGKNKFS